MTDQLCLLRKENKLRMKCLRKINQSMLEKWMEYTKASDINPYDYELCCKELIGIARQKEIEYKNLECFFGDDPRSTAEDIIQSCRKKNWKDYILFDLKETFALLTVIWLIAFIITGGAFQPIDLYSIMLNALIIVLFFLYRKLSGTFKVRQKRILKNLEPDDSARLMIDFFCTVLCLLPVILLQHFTPTKGIVISEFPKIILPGTFCILWIILTILRIKYTNKLAKERPWQDI